MKKLNLTIKPLTLTTTTVARLVASSDLAQVAGGGNTVTAYCTVRTRFSGGVSCAQAC